MPNQLLPSTFVSVDDRWAVLAMLLMNVNKRLFVVSIEWPIEMRMDKWHNYLRINRLCKLQNAV